MWDDFRKIIKTRKNHICAITGDLIPVGSSCWQWVGHWDGEFQSWYACDEAKNYMDSTGAHGYCSDIGEEMRCGNKV